MIVGYLTSVQLDEYFRRCVDEVIEATPRAYRSYSAIWVRGRKYAHLTAKFRTVGLSIDRLRHFEPLSATKLLNERW